jgi:hypothetical protein
MLRDSAFAERLLKVVPVPLFLFPRFRIQVNRPHQGSVIQFLRIQCKTVRVFVADAPTPQAICTFATVNVIVAPVVNAVHDVPLYE